MSIKAALKVLFARDERPLPAGEQSVTEISKDLAVTLGKLEARDKALTAKAVAMEAAAAAAMEARRVALAEQVEATALAKRIGDLVAAPSAPALAVAASAPAAADAGGNKRRA